MKVTSFFVVREFYKFIFEKLLMGVINFYDSLKRSTGSSIIKLYVLFTNIIKGEIFYGKI